MKGLFTYDMIRDIWIPLLSGIIGGLFTLVGVVLTVRYERKKEQRDYMEKIKPYLVVQHLSDLSKDEIQHLKKASIPNDSPNPCVSITPNHIYYHWENLVISNIGNYACILAYIKINNSPYAFPTKSPIKPGESFQIVGQWVSVYIFPEIESMRISVRRYIKTPSSQNTVRNSTRLLQHGRPRNIPLYLPLMKMYPRES